MRAEKPGATEHNGVFAIQFRKRAQAGSTDRVESHGIQFTGNPRSSRKYPTLSQLGRVSRFSYAAAAAVGLGFEVLPVRQQGTSTIARSLPGNSMHRGTASLLNSHKVSVAVRSKRVASRQSEASITASRDPAKFGLLAHDVGDLVAREICARSAMSSTKKQEPGTSGLGKGCRDRRLGQQRHSHQRWPLFGQANDPHSSLAPDMRL